MERGERQVVKRREGHSPTPWLVSKDDAALASPGSSGEDRFFEAKAKASSRT